MNAAAFTWDLEIVPYLISQGADVTAADASGLTPLHHVVRNTTAAAVSIVQACCMAGADPAAKDKAGNTPLSEAKKRKAPVLAVLEACAAKGRPVGEAEMETLRACAWYADWKAAVFKTIDQAFDGDASTVQVQTSRQRLRLDFFLR